MAVLTFKNPEGKTIKVNSPDGSTPSEQELDSLFKSDEGPISKAVKGFAKNAEPALKLAWAHPETLAGHPALKAGGIPLTPEELDKELNQDWGALARSVDYPGSKSSSFAAQLLPEAAGAITGTAVNPMTYIAPKVMEGIGIAGSQIPAVRGMMETHLPTFTKGILNKYTPTHFEDMLGGIMGPPGVPSPKPIPPNVLNTFEGKPVGEVQGTLRTLTAAKELETKIAAMQLQRQPTAPLEAQLDNLNRAIEPKIKSVADVERLINFHKDEMGGHVAQAEMVQPQAEQRVASLQSKMPVVARQTVENLRNPSLIYNTLGAGSPQARQFKTGFGYFSKGILVPEAGQQEIAFQAALKQGLIDAQGNIIKMNPQGPEKKLISYATKVGALSEGGAGSEPFTEGLPRSTVKAIQNLHPDDPVLRAEAFKQLQKQGGQATARGFGFKQADYTQPGKEVPLSQFLDDIAGITDSTHKGLPTSADRTLSNVHSASMDWIDAHAQEIGLTEEKQAVYAHIKAMYKPYVQGKGAFYDVFEPWNPRGMYNAQKGIDFLTAHGNGEVPAGSDAEKLAQFMKSQIDPNFDKRLLQQRGMVQIAQKNLAQIDNNIANGKLQIADAGKFGALKDALSNAKTEAGKFQAIKNMENFITTYTPKRLTYSVLNMLIRKLTG